MMRTNIVSLGVDFWDAFASRLLNFPLIARLQCVVRPSIIFALSFKACIADSALT